MIPELSDSSCCHILPCEISDSGRAPINDYFKPALLQKSREAKDSYLSNDENVHYQVATFRGRGLMAHELNKKVQAMVATGNDCEVDDLKQNPDSTLSMQRTMALAGRVFDVHSDNSNSDKGNGISREYADGGEKVRSNDQVTSLNEVATFTHLKQWYHEHDMQSLESNCNDDLHRTLSNWMETCSALHSPLPKAA